MYLFEPKWLSRRNVSLDENLRIEILRSTFKKGCEITSEERSGIGWDLKKGYQALFDAGIIEDENRITLVGTPLTAGYWKSFVEVEKGKRWKWNNESFGEILRTQVTLEIAKHLGLKVGPYELDHGDDALLEHFWFMSLHSLKTRSSACIRRV